ncbi:hypothetical protein F511_28881 [Dorcoceras hygrometricum]|uniref:Uncharacterized protein n=1 Tax=Dorcoceras hygrometricum TaxID=472368 RepID=A0A2Z7CUI4_9LAMI|nr:hypothetical protein F511_28881 [Dorcoceras hygrometricum]
MRQQFSGSDEPFKAPNKKKEMKIEFRLQHNIVAKALSAKAGCTISTDEFCTNGFSSSNRPERIPATQGGGGARRRV